MREKGEKVDFPGDGTHRGARAKTGPLLVQSRAAAQKKHADIGKAIGFADIAFA